MKTLSLIALTAALAIASPRDDESSYILTSDDPAQLKLVGFGPDTITIKDKEIRLTGKPNGYFATRKSYKDYTLKFEWMYEKPDGYKPGDKFEGNSGVLIHLAPPDKVWPKCIEAQLAYAEAGHVFAINGATFEGKTDRDALKKAIKPVGEWNEAEIVCKGDSITCTMNGIKIASGTGASPAEGPIGFQAEGAPIRFRYLRVKPLN
jgi:Domain of Unknown Function (DUF1080)